MRYNFEWDPVKAKKNFRKHQVSFERATQVFLDPIAISIFDDEHSIEEDRWITLGKDNNGVLLVVGHTFKEHEADQRKIRIINARKATKHESQQYGE
ncbi:BrnT family toxin [candidate division KSB1 bacterium]|nr:BrnT family toxin [candidate division KSB1 bacterium]